MLYPQQGQEINQEISKNITRLVCKLSNLIIIVVGEIKVPEQILIDKLKNKYKNLIIVHNFKRIYNEVAITSKMSAVSSTLDQKDITKSSLNYILVGQSAHVFFINDYCEYGMDYNRNSLEFLSEHIKTKGTGRSSINVFNEIYSYLADPILYARGKKRQTTSAMESSGQEVDRVYYYKSKEVSVFQMKENSPGNSLVLKRETSGNVAYGIIGIRFRPIVDTFEVDNKFVIVIELPGIGSTDDIKFAWSKMLFIISGEKINDCGELQKSKRKFGRFQKYFKVPQGFNRNYASTIKDGVLKIEFKPRRRLLE